MSLADRPKLALWGQFLRIWLVGRKYLILKLLSVFEQKYLRFMAKSADNDI